MGRGMTIAVLCAAGVGSVGGGLIALHVSPGSSITQPTPSIGSAATSQPTPPRPMIVAEPITPPDPHVALAAQIQAILSRVPDWTRAHPSAPCPDITALGVATIDPWGHRIELTCTDQPADQIIGALSAGPDGISGNSDDVKSWNLGPSVTQLVQGRRWTPSSTAPAATSSIRPTPSKRRKPPITPGTAPTAATAATPSPAKPSITPTSTPEAADGIPTRR
jgi:hypothetical protein